MFYEDVFRAFEKADVKYVIVGGLAVNLLGSMRSTNDLDILVEMSDENLAKVVRILKSKGFSVKQPVDPIGIADRRIRDEWIRGKHLKALNFYRGVEMDEVDIIIDTPVSYEDALKDLQLIACGRLQLPVISVDALIRMKNKAARAIDKLDIELLKGLKKAGGKA